MSKFETEFKYNNDKNALLPIRWNMELISDDIQKYKNTISPRVTRNI